jgi:hypothetical protein
MRHPSPPSSWASDLRHPLPLAAVALLALNDHVLKGAHLLPAAVTGKLSDVAGLFFFPLLLVALVRGAHRALAGRDVADRRSLAAAAVLATGAVFALLKLHAPFNAWVTAAWGVNVMDPTDLWALPVLPLAAAFMLRGAPAARSPASPSRPFLDYAAVVAAGLASVATSKAPEPVQAPPQPPPAAAVAVARPVGCAAYTLPVCERSPSTTYVVVEATGTGAEPCSIDVTEARELDADGPGMSADRLPARVVVNPGQRATFALQFLWPMREEAGPGPVTVRLAFDHGARAEVVDMTRACKPR